MKYAAIKQAVADAAKESKKKIESLVSERAMLLQRLEKKAREGEARAEEERLALEKEGGGEEERLKLEAKLLREREEASKEREKMLEVMEEIVDAHEDMAEEYVDAHEDDEFFAMDHKIPPAIFNRQVTHIKHNKSLFKIEGKLFIWH